MFYLTAGVFFIPSNLPKIVRDVLWFNPLLHSVEWLRSAYYVGYGYGMLDRGYLVGYATVVLVLGMALERAVRGKLMEIN